MLITGLLAVALLAAAMWGNVMPSPFSRPFSSPEPTEAAAQRVPCPPADALPAPFDEITTNVFNATDRSGLAAQTAGALSQFGIVVSQQTNYGGTFAGVANIVSGPRGLRAAHTVAALIPGSTVTLDGRDDGIVDVVLGSSFDQVTAAEAAPLDPESPLVPPPGCAPVAVPEDDEMPAEVEETEETSESDGSEETADPEDA